MIKKLTTLLIAILVLVLLSATAFAEDTTTTGTGDVTATIPVEGSIDALDISVTHPISIQYTIDPNAGLPMQFVAPPISLTNNSSVNISVSIQSITATAGGTIQFTDVAYDTYTTAEWAALNKADSKTYITFGVIKDAAHYPDWAVSTTDTYYATETGTVKMGEIAPGATSTMGINGKHGLAFDQAYTAQHEIVFVFSIA